MIFETENYSANARNLDQALDQATRPAARWNSRQPTIPPPIPALFLELPCGDSLHLQHNYDTDWTGTLCVLAHVSAGSLETAQADIVEPVILCLERALADLRDFHRKTPNVDSGAI